MIKVHSKMNRVGALCALFVLLSCTWDLPKPTWAVEPLRIVELPTNQRWGGTTRDTITEWRSLAWLDDRQLMYAGFTPGKYNARGISSEHLDFGIFIWDTQSNQVRRYSDDENFCYANGWIHRQSPTSLEDPANPAQGGYTPEVTVHFGPVGQEKAKSCPLINDPRFAHKYSEGCQVEIFALNMSCKPKEYRHRQPPLPSDIYVAAQLRTGDGAIGHPDGADPHKEVTQPFRLFNNRFPSGKPLPILGIEGMGVVTYADFAGKYVLIGTDPKDGKAGVHTNWPEGKPYPVYLMNRDGQVEQIDIPKVADWVGVHIVQLSRAGLIYYGSHGLTGGGVFRYQPGGRHDALDRGQVGTITVSPDGCKAAWAIINDYGRGPLESRIKYADLCQGKN